MIFCRENIYSIQLIMSETKEGHQSSILLVQFISKLQTLYWSHWLPYINHFNHYKNGLIVK